MSGTLNIGQEVGKYKVKEYLKTYGLDNAESYKVVTDEGKEAIMKLMIDGCNSIEFSDKVAGIMSSNASMPSVLDTGKITIDSIEYDYVVREFVKGPRLSDILNCGVTYDWEEAVPIVLQVLDALKDLHGEPLSILHNDVTPRNVILNRRKVVLVGMTHLSMERRVRSKLLNHDLNPWYMAPETFRRRFSVQSDIFSVGALLFRLIFGTEPWRNPDFADDASVEALRELRRTPVKDICTGPSMRKLNEKQINILSNMLAPDYDDRYATVELVISALTRSLEDDEEENQDDEIRRLEDEIMELCMEDIEVEDVEEEVDPRRGFAGVAGLDDVKSLLSDEVMYVLNNPDKARRYRLRAPNGMLFYGPPGCGKSYFAEKFAQESQFNFVMVKASDLGSIYIHGTQGKIKELFDQAAEDSPTVLCFDELDGMVPDRSKVTNEGAAGEVNEFLTQLNNCSERGIFVIGTTNRPNLIDPAVLRSGRMDHLIYIPLPDMEARKELFRIHLSDRPLAEDVDLELLAGKTEGYVASDIELIVNKTALAAAKMDEPIGQQLLEKTIPTVRKSVSDSEKAAYETMRQQMESKPKAEERRRIGFAMAK